MHLSSSPCCGGAHAAKSLVFCRLLFSLSHCIDPSNSGVCWTLNFPCVRDCTTWRAKYGVLWSTALLSDDGCNRILFTFSFIYTSLSCRLTQGKLRVQQTPEFEGSIQWLRENNSRQNTKDLAAAKPVCHLQQVVRFCLISVILTYTTIWLSCNCFTIHYIENSSVILRCSVILWCMYEYPMKTTDLPPATSKLKQVQLTKTRCTWVHPHVVVGLMLLNL
jgi:hypothetical protein